MHTVSDIPMQLQREDLPRNRRQLRQRQGQHLYKAHEGCGAQHEPRRDRPVCHRRRRQQRRRPAAWRVGQSDRQQNTMRLQQDVGNLGAQKDGCWGLREVSSIILLKCKTCKPIPLCLLILCTYMTFKQSLFLNTELQSEGLLLSYFGDNFKLLEKK